MTIKKTIFGNYRVTLNKAELERVAEVVDEGHQRADAFVTYYQSFNDPQSANHFRSLANDAYYLLQNVKKMLTGAKSVRFW